jgi:UDP-N-acetylmuramate--alanine ligase
MHFAGIGGAGMSALAEILRAHGHIITGSDRQETPLTKRLESLGIGIQYNHEPRLIRDAQYLVYSSAVHEDNPERQYAVENGIVSIRRAEVLGDLMRASFTVCVAGTHGKTTTTSLTGQVFLGAGLDPTVMVGGTLKSHGSNAVIGHGDILIAEADEYDRSFLAMYPAIAIVTNIEADHLDCYRDEDDIKNTFKKFADRIPFYGALIACADDANTAVLANQVSCAVITYGLNVEADYQATNIRFIGGHSRFAVFHHGVALGEIDVPLSGLHNVSNALAAITCGIEMKIPFAVIRKSLTSFAGVRRRFELLGSINGISVFDDYAHHPSEIAATLSAARHTGLRRVVAVFQPHLYSRTRDFMSQFADSLSHADAVVVCGIYKAREEAIPGVSAEGIVKKMNENGYTDVRYVENKSDVAEAIVTRLESGDLIVLMGAGDICDIGTDLLERIRHSATHRSE